MDAFNRHAWRAAYFISAFMQAKEYMHWGKEFFVEFYENGSALKGYSEKVIACFLQQGFGKSEIIPIDTWIETFYCFPLGISSRSNFYNSFSNLGKLERIIWLSSQANKTNMKNFFNLLWCQRYGVTGNSELRGINPIACYRCELKNTCVGLKRKCDKYVFIINDLAKDKMRDIEEVIAKEKSKHKEKKEAVKEAIKKNEDITKEEIKAIKENIENERTVTKEKISDILGKKVSADYICFLENGIPQKAYRLDKLSYKLVDEFSGYILGDNDKIPQGLIAKGEISMKEFIEN